MANFSRDRQSRDVVYSSDVLAAARQFSEVNERIRSVSKVPLAPQPVTLKHSHPAW
jgi:hypothetical protein